ncbi:SPOR domain-containing protein [Undibacterium oligocarboniphilum]|uniref:SPOR domain-containing protein n=1 Tax=Undibacterium oligocarboniphilum TaxID=666702 RepID=A0A850QEW1_9BURK|nr:SPOR domain-containing protein [Undibacterium oligocarboniphilum]MBC3870120.1 SPOR domain-containing protein [Undibacterium oligocarboniphilum]NVO78111.1 SPOR domain-containing protein [Undibacterium oligocarboniphilum]
MGLFSRFKKQETSDSHDSGEFRSRAEEDSAQSRSRSKKADASRRKTDDPVLPEKKRARRRLIGAVALALAAIIGLPMLLDSEPRPLPDDIAIRIPSKDSKANDSSASQPAEQVNPRKTIVSADDAGEEIIDPVSADKVKRDVPQPAGKTAAVVAAGAATVATVTALSQNRPEKTVTATSAAPARSDGKSDNLSAVKPDARNELRTEPKTEVKADTKTTVTQGDKYTVKEPAVKAERKTEHPDIKSAASANPAVKTQKPAGNEDEAARAMAILEGKAPPKPIARPAGKTDVAEKASVYQVQVAALASQDKVDELQSKLKAAGIRSYTQKVATASGEKIRVRVGPFSSRDEAEKMRARLVKQGLNGTLVPN